MIFWMCEICKLFVVDCVVCMYEYNRKNCMDFINVNFFCVIFWLED